MASSASPASAFAAACPSVPSHFDDLPHAQSIAAELGYDWVCAVWMTTFEYQARLGLPLCTLDRAAELKAATVRACREHFRKQATA